MQTLSDIPTLPAFHSLKPPPASTPSILALTATLGLLYRITVTHTPRLFLGTFVALDPQGNLVLDQALEFELDGEGRVVGDPRGREVGLVMVPRRWWKTVERVKTEEEMDDEARQQGEGCRPS
ncbi:hypothetical protein JCM8547_006870 [Rhodosporidiobolus lusitaniae]